MQDFNEVINRKGTYSSQWDYTFDRFGKNDVLPFSISDMDFKSPNVILKAISKRVEHGIFGYSRWNHDDYKKAISNWYKLRFNYVIEHNWIMYTPSVIYTINKIFEVIGNKTDKVLFVSPAYDNFFKSLKANGQNYITSTLLVQNNKFVINWKDFEEKLKDSKFFLLCNPHNPTGRVWTNNELETIVSLCKKHNVIIVSDDVHMDIVYLPNKFIPVLQVAQKLDYINNTIVVTSCAKSFNTASLGGSYCLIPNKQFYNKIINKIKEQDSLGSPMILGIISLISAYKEGAYWLDNLVKYCYNNIQLLQNFFKENLENFQLFTPEGTYLTWIDVSKLDMNLKEIQTILVNKGNLGIMGGDIYGESKPFLRLNIACPQSKLLEGLTRLKKSF